MQKSLHIPARPTGRIKAVRHYTRWLHFNTFKNPKRMKKRSPVGFPAALFAVGLGMSMYYGYAWYQLPVYNDAELAQSVDINLAMDMQRQNKPMPTDPAKLAELKAAVRADLDAVVSKERRETLGAFSAGLIGLLLALGQFLLLWRLRKRQ